MELKMRRNGGVWDSGGMNLWVLFLQICSREIIFYFYQKHKRNGESDSL